MEVGCLTRGTNISAYVTSKGANFGTKLCPEKGVLHIGYVIIQPSVQMRSRHTFGANASAGKARAGMAEAHVRLARVQGTCLAR